MSFVGFLVLQNVLKKQTTPVIEEINEANIRTVMVTGMSLNLCLFTSRHLVNKT